MNTTGTRSARAVRVTSQLLLTLASLLSTAIAVLLLGPAGAVRAHGEDDLPPLEETAETFAKASDTGGGLPVALIAGGAVLVLAVIATAVIVKAKRKSD